MNTPGTVTANPTQPAKAVVFLPGIMGSRLEWQTGGWRWDPDSTWAMLPWYRKAICGGSELARIIHHNQPAAVMTTMSPAAPVAGRGWEGVSCDYYHGLLRELEGVLPTYAIGYDWRQDVRDEVARVFSRLREMNVPTPFVLVTHSMGGLLARAVLASELKSDERKFAAQVRGVVNICQPCHGAPVLYRRLFTGCSSLDIQSWLDRIFCRILGRTPSRFTTNVAGMPGALQLLPSFEYEYPAGAKLTGWSGSPGAFVRELYGANTCPPGLGRTDVLPTVRALLARQLESVAALHAAIRGVFHSNSWFLLGDGLNTDLGFYFAGNQTTQVRLPAGDGTVPFVSASGGAQTLVDLATLCGAPADHRVGVGHNVEHAGACGDPGIQRAVIEITKHLA